MLCLKQEKFIFAFLLQMNFNGYSVVASPKKQNLPKTGMFKFKL